MTGKVQRILSEIASRKLCTMDEHMAFYNDKAKEDYRFFSEIQEVIKTLQEEPVSEELEKAAIKAFKEIVDTNKNNFLEIFKAGAQWGKNQAKVEIQAQSMALAHGCTKETVSKELEEEIDNYVKRNGYDGLDSKEEVKYIANHFTKWQKEQFEKDCTDLCNGIATAKGIAVAMAYNKGMADAREQLMKDAIDAEASYTLVSM